MKLNLPEFFNTKRHFSVYEPRFSIYPMHASIVVDYGYIVTHAVVFRFQFALVPVYLNQKYSVHGSVCCH